MLNLGNFFFVLEILLAELSLLFFYPKKKHFWIIYPIAFALCCGIALVVPSIDSWRSSQIYIFFKYLILFGMTVGAMFFCFKTPFINLLSACGAGYALQHIGNKTVGLLMLTGLLSNVTDTLTRMHWIELFVMPLVFVLAILFLGIPAKKNQYYKNRELIFIIPPLLTLFVCLVLTRFASLDERQYSLSTCCYAITCCVLCLFFQYHVHSNVTLKKEKRDMALLYMKNKEQYEMKKKDIELLNIKYHDMKKRLKEIESLTPDEISSIKQIVKVYATHFKTGSEVLDTILTDKTSKLTDSGVEITFMGDASSLNVISVGDCYSLFENILDNALEAVSKFEDKNKKTIGLQVSKRGDLTVINCYNYYVGEIKMVNGLPETTKVEEVGFHGYGMKSIKIIAEKYSGGLNISTESGVFDLSIYLMTH